MLKTEKDDPEIALDILAHAPGALRLPSEVLHVFYEHGQHWVENSETGATWSVVDAVPGPWSFEQVSEGEGEG